MTEDEKTETPDEGTTIGIDINKDGRPDIFVTLKGYRDQIMFAAGFIAGYLGAHVVGLI